MIAKIRRPIALLLVLLTLLGSIPFGYADEMKTTQSEPGVDPPKEEVVPTEVSPSDSPQSNTATEPQSERQTEPATVPAGAETAEEATAPTETLGEMPSGDSRNEPENDLLPNADMYAPTQNSIMLFDYADNGDYTTRLNYQVSCTYKPNGTDTTRKAYVKNMGGDCAR